MEFQNQTRLLALARVPRDGVSIHDWVPFPGGDKLTDIVDHHNERCIEACREERWSDYFIKTLTEVIRIVPHDLSSVEKLRPADFETIGILLADLADIKTAAMELEGIKVFMGRYDRIYHLAQVCRDPATKSCKSLFEPLPIVPSRPEILPTQYAFESFLGNLCDALRLVIREVGPPVHVRRRPGMLPIKPRSKWFSRFAASVRDAAMARDLTPPQTMTLARNAAMQESALGRVGQLAGTKTRYRVNVDGIRPSLFEVPAELPVEAPATQKEVVLLGLSLADPDLELNPGQKHLLADLGVRGKTFTAVHFDTPRIRMQVKQLGDVVEATRFSTELPGWFTR